MKKAFTIVELLVVIGIISLLMGVLVVSMSSGTDSARAAKCLTNLKNLSTAFNSFAMNTGRYALAGSIEAYAFDESQGVKNVREKYYEQKGWISWYSQQGYKNNPSSHIASSAWFISAYEQDFETREYCLTNGALWKYVSGNREVYVCPIHNRDMPKNNKPAWSYVMNSVFGFDDTKGTDAKSPIYFEYGTLDRADRTILFGELQWAKLDSGSMPNTSASSGFENDCTLQYEEDMGKECIGFNHRDGKDMLAHVVFADGHIEKLRQPKKGMSEHEMWELTKWLCEGKDVSFNGRQYEELKN